MADYDWAATSDPTGLGSSVQPYIAEKPSHVTIRNYMYFDGHAGTKRVSTWQNF